MTDRDPDHQKSETDARVPLADFLAGARLTIAADPVLFLAAALGLAVAAGCSLVFAKLLDDVMGADDAAALDPWLLTWVVDHRTSPFTSAARAVTHLGDPALVIAAAAVCTIALFLMRRPRLALLLLICTSGVSILTTVAKYAVDRGRPPQSLWLTTARGPAFPSGHSAQAIALYATLAVVGWVLFSSPWIRAGLVAAAVLIATLVGLSRFYLAVHWASDVVAGWAIATLWLSMLLLIGWARPRIIEVWRLGRHRAEASNSRA